jgi:hypothetical protein
MHPAVNRESDTSSKSLFPVAVTIGSYRTLEGEIPEDINKA